MFPTPRRSHSRSRRTSSLVVELLESRDLLTFLNPLFFPVGVFPLGLAVGDFTRDGRPDLVTANTGGSSVSVLVGHPQTVFQPAVHVPAGVAPVGVAVASYPDKSALLVSDILGQGEPPSYDLFEKWCDPWPACQWQDTQHRYVVPQGGFPRQLTTGDFNRDGLPDLAIAHAGGSTVGVLLRSRYGTFDADQFNAGLDPRSLATGDFNGDSKLDLVTVSPWDNKVRVLLGNGAGDFSPALATSLPNGAISPVWVAVGHFNQDSFLDVVTANTASNNLSVLLGNGTGNFPTARPNVPTGLIPFGVAVADFNRDGINDLVAANAVSSVIVHFGDGTGAFPWPLGLFVSGIPVAVVTGHFNTDTYPDVAVACLACGTGDRVVVWLNSAGWGQGPHGGGGWPFPAGDPVGDCESTPASGAVLEVIPERDHAPFQPASDTAGTAVMRNLSAGPCVRAAPSWGSDFDPWTLDSWAWSSWGERRSDSHLW